MRTRSIAALSRLTSSNDGDIHQHRRRRESDKVIKELASADKIAVEVSIAGGLLSLRRLQPNVDILLLREGEHLFEAFLAPQSGLLEAAKRRAEEMLADLVDPHESRFRCAVERSLVQIEAVSTYSTWLTSASILASLFHLKTPSTGPKISSRAMRIDMLTLANTVGST